MTRALSGTTDAARRCPDEDSNGGRCQLSASHDSEHAAAADGAYLTWQGSDVYRWASSWPPRWLVMLPWAPGFQPQVPYDDTDPPRIPAA